MSQRLNDPPDLPPVLRPAATATPETAAPAAGAVVVADPQANGAGEEVEEVLPAGVSAFWMTMLPSWLLSMVVHLSILLLMGVMLVPRTWVEPIGPVTATTTSESEDLFDSLTDLNPNAGPITSGEDLTTLEGSSEGIESGTLSEVIEGAGALEPSTAETFSTGGAQRSFAVGPTIGAPLLADTPLSTSMGSIAGSGIEGRAGDLRKMLVASGGGSSASEAAVARALDWIVKHQLPDGGWSFDHGLACQGKCKNPGEHFGKARNGATAMALLPLLGAGQTHRVGKYQRQVENGLAYLIRNMKVEENRGDLGDPIHQSLYSHGLAAIALCEAYAMTNDRQLKAPAQAALNFTMFAQLKDGGWRYHPSHPNEVIGDTSAVGWQVMALKSGKLAGLDVKDEVFVEASRFLDGVQREDEARFKYTVETPYPPGAGTTSAGWLCRMYLGTGKDDPKLAKGVAYLTRVGPAKSNSYVRYYATQVMHHYGGDAWRDWNRGLRDILVSTQAREGHEAGSWFYEEPHATEAGRLYITSLNTMMLEVYYRHLPLYHEKSFGE